MSFASPAELAAYLQRDPFADGAETTSAQLALDIATSIVVARTGQDFAPVVGDTITLDSGGEDIYLPQRPVNAVTSVTTRGRGSTSSTTATLNAEYEVRGHRLRWVGLGGVWPYEVTVTYDHGYATIPDDVKGATLAVAAEIHANPEGLSSSALDDSNDRHEWADDSPAERMLKLVEGRYARKPLSVRMR